MSTRMFNTGLRTIIILLLLSLSALAQGKVEKRESALFARAIETYLHEQVGNGFSGSVIVARTGKLILNKTYGKTFGSDTFWIASNSKSFTAVAILRLAEQGKLSTRDPITKFLRNVPADKSSITIHHLLTHTSGLPHRYAADGVSDRDAAVNTILSLPLRNKPGEKFGYSNDGYSLLAAIVEIVSLRTFENYLQREVLDPADLDRTGFWGFENRAFIAPVADPTNLSSVVPTVYKDGHSVPNWGYRGATGMFSTAHDMYRWMIALHEGKVLRAATVAELWGKQTVQSTDGDEEVFYGFGFSSRYKAGKRIYLGHTGFEDWLGHSSVMRLLENGDAVVVLSNSGRNGESAWASAAEREIRKLMGH